MNPAEFNKDQKPNFAGFVVIGSGLPRTGTNSLRTALNILLDGAIYHMYQVAFGKKVDATFWEKVHTMIKLNFLKTEFIFCFS